MNHIPTESQLEQLRKEFDIAEFLYLPEEIKNFISNVPPEKDIPDKILSKITEFIEKNLSKGDYVWIQTEYGITFYVVDFALKKGFIPIYSTTKRVYTEKRLDKNEIERKYLFKHVRFRKYKKFSR